MCGIAGFIDGTSARTGDPRALLGRMIGAIRHRGPDAQELWTGEGAGLAHARLSIIDLEGGRQPMTNEDGTLWITFNGEIFNYIELREWLIARGHRFATSSDTEVILHLYEEEGDACVERLNGQWAFGLWDTRRKRLFLSRDRMGVRPLFYTTLGSGQFLFASEIKALFMHQGVGRAIDPAGLDEIFTYWVNVAPRTVFQGISELPPAHSLVLERGTARTFRYWQLKYAEPEHLNGNFAAQEERYADELLNLMVDATRLRLRADVPVGAYLSGGLDSAITTALIKKYGSASLETFSVAFEDPEFDESAHQQEVVRHLGTRHHEMRCTSGQIADCFPRVVWHMEKPVLRTAPAPLYLLSEAVRESGYKVVLTGEGADEVLGGYDIFKEAKIRRFCSAHPESRTRPLLLRRLYPYLTKIQAQSDAYRKAFFNVGGDIEGPFYSHIPRWELTSKLKMFFSPGLRDRLRTECDYEPVHAALPSDYADWHWFQKAQYLETAFLLPGYILSSQGDRVAMAHGVEGRYPFLDYRVVEFASRIPPNLKMRVLNEKYLLKRMAAELVPPAVRKRTKQPYRAPEAATFFDGRSGYVAELLSSERIRRDGIFDPDMVEKLTGKVRQGKAQGIRDNMAVAGILSTQLLVDQFTANFSRHIS